MQGQCGGCCLRTAILKYLTMKRNAMQEKLIIRYMSETEVMEYLIAQSNGKKDISNK